MNEDMDIEKGKKEILLLIPGMHGGGAERVMGILADGFAKGNWNTTLMLMSQKVEDMVGYRLSEGVHVESILERLKKPSQKDVLYYGIVKTYTRIWGTMCEVLKLKVSDKLAYDTFVWQHYEKIRVLREYLIANPERSVIAFLQPAVNIALLASQGLPNKVIISERADPNRYCLTRYMPYFAKKWYPKSYKIVFQTSSAQDYFPEEVKCRSTVIFNPLKPTLPESYHREREKKVVNFCRLSEQKNIPLLIDAFEEFYKIYSEYKLEIWGEGELEDEMRAYIREKGLDDCIIIKPFDSTLHETIKKYAMFVSSSDYEGMSNSMLEAMAIGLPTICTDCPAGGARAIIRDHENGLLVPIRDRVALCNAMKEVAADEELSKKLSVNGTKVREELHVDAIVRKWMGLLL